MDNQFELRFASEKDVPLILQLIRELAEYEGLLHEVVATGEILTEWLFVKKKAEVLIGEYGGQPVGYALFFHSTHLPRPRRDLPGGFVCEAEYRGRGYGKAFSGNWRR